MLAHHKAQRTSIFGTGSCTFWQADTKWWNSANISHPHSPWAQEPHRDAFKGLSYTAIHSSNIIFMFADHTSILGSITNGDKTAYRHEVRAPSKWCCDNNLNVSKTKEMIVDFRRTQKVSHAPLQINGSAVERVKRNKFLGVHIWWRVLVSAHHIIKSQKRLVSGSISYWCWRALASLPKSSPTFTDALLRASWRGAWRFCMAAVPSSNKRALQRVMRTAELIIGIKLPTLQDIYRLRKARKITTVVFYYCIEVDCLCPHKSISMYTITDICTYDK